jgi:hypothetical protein
METFGTEEGTIDMPEKALIAEFHFGHFGERTLPIFRHNLILRQLNS